MIRILIGTCGPIYYRSSMEPVSAITFSAPSFIVIFLKPMMIICVWKSWNYRLNYPLMRDWLSEAFLFFLFLYVVNWKNPGLTHLEDHYSPLAPSPHFSLNFRLALNFCSFKFLDYGDFLCLCVWWFLRSWFCFCLRSWLFFLWYSFACDQRQAWSCVRLVYMIRSRDFVRRIVFQNWFWSQL